MKRQALLFVNKKKQKNFNRFRAGRFHHRAKRSKKVFWYLFFKKVTSSFSPSSVTFFSKSFT